jgi:hypothetical protein
MSGAIRGCPEWVYASSGITRLIPPLRVCWTSDPHDPWPKTLTHAGLIRRQIRRGQVLKFLASLPSCRIVIGPVVCGSRSSFSDKLGLPLH